MEKNPKRVAIDLDGVCFCFDKHMCELIGDLFGIEITPSEITEYEWNKIPGFGITKRMWEEAFYKFIISGGFQELDMYPGARFSLHKIQESGFEIYYITDRPKDSRAQTLVSIAKHNLPINGLLFNRNKGALAKSLGVVAAIDDKDEHIQSYEDFGITSFRMKKGYNGERKLTVSSLEEFFKNLQSLAN